MKEKCMLNGCFPYHLQSGKLKLSKEEAKDELGATDVLIVPSGEVQVRMEGNIIQCV